ncbi:MAG: glycosyltransferase [Alphaproteobacteria bacterium]|nr:glycosyltransferase [Alphaproteobacteria bacterium]
MTHQFFNPPQVSVICLTYNQESLVEQAFAGLMAQDYPNFEVIFSDDGSTDRTFEILCALAQQAPAHVKVLLHRNNPNLGLVPNYCQAFSLTQGELIFSAAGDDISEPDRISSCVREWIRHGRQHDLIATDFIDMDFDGTPLGLKPIDNLQDWDINRWLLERPYHAGASHMVTRRLLELRPINKDTQLEDQALLFRALLMGRALRISSPLVRHRRGGISAQIGPQDFETKILALLKSAQRSMGDYRQYKDDALHTAQHDQVLRLIDQEMRTREYILAILSSKTTNERWHLLKVYRDISIRKRLRFFLLMVMKPCFQWVFLLKIKLHSARRHT